MAAEKKAVRLLEETLKVKGPLPAVRLAGCLAQAAKEVRVAAGRNSAGVLQFVMQHPETFNVSRSGEISLKDKVEELDDSAIDIFVSVLAKYGHIPVNQFPRYFTPLQSEALGTAGGNIEGLQAFIRDRPQLFYTGKDGEVDLVVRCILKTLPPPTDLVKHICTIILITIKVFLEAFADDQAGLSENGEKVLSMEYVCDELIKTTQGSLLNQSQDESNIEEALKQILCIQMFKKHPNNRFSVTMHSITKKSLFQLISTAMLEGTDYVLFQEMLNRMSSYRLVDTEQFTSTLEENNRIANNAGLLGFIENEVFASASFILNILENEVSLALDTLESHLLSASLPIQTHIQEKGLENFLKEHPQLFGKVASGDIVSRLKATSKISGSTSADSIDSNLAEVTDLFLLTKIMSKLVFSQSISRWTLASSKGMPTELREVIIDNDKWKSFISLHPLLLEISEDGSSLQRASNNAIYSEWRMVTGKITSVTKNAAQIETSDGESVSIISRKHFFFCSKESNGRRKRDVAKSRMADVLKVGEELSCMVVRSQDSQWIPILSWLTVYNQWLFSYTLRWANDLDQNLDRDYDSVNGDGLTESSAENKKYSPNPSSKPAVKMNPSAPKQKAVVKKTKPQLANNTKAQLLLKSIVNVEDLYSLLSCTILMLLGHEEMPINTLFDHLHKQSTASKTFVKCESDLEELLSLYDIFAVGPGSVCLRGPPSVGVVTYVETLPDETDGSYQGFISGEEGQIYFTHDSVFIPKEPLRSCHIDNKVHLKSLVEYFAIPLNIVPSQSAGSRTTTKMALLVWPKKGPNAVRGKASGVKAMRKKEERLSDLDGGDDVEFAMAVSEGMLECRPAGAMAVSEGMFRPDGEVHGSGDVRPDLVDVGCQTFSTGAVLLTKHC